MSKTMVVMTRRHSILPVVKFMSLSLSTLHANYKSFSMHSHRLLLNETYTSCLPDKAVAACLASPGQHDFMWVLLH